MIVYDLYSLSTEDVNKAGLKEIVTSRTFIREGVPDPEGLASYEIFGMPGSPEREKTFAYIKLNDLFLQPQVYNDLKFIKRQYVELIRGTYDFYIENGDIHKIIPNATIIPKNAPVGSGPKFLYKHWEKLNFNYKDIPAGMRANRLRFLKNIKKNQAFINKLEVIPPFYRDVDVSGNRKNEYNEYYEKLINFANTINSTKDITGVFSDISATHLSIMDTINEMHEKIIKLVGGRKGFVHKNVMGKSIDYSARLVISSTDISKCKYPDDMPSNYYRSVIPLFAAIKCFAPFIVHEFRNIIEDTLAGNNYIWAIDKKGNTIRKELSSSWRNILTSKYINYLIELYDESLEHRLDPVLIPTEDGDEVPLAYTIYKGDNEKELEFKLDPNEFISKNIKNIQPLRLIHIFYMAIQRFIDTKHIYITRYPIENHHSMYPSKPYVVPYKNNKKMTVNGIEYPNFPIVNYEKDIPKVESLFIDSLEIFSAYLSALGGDFDGDQVSVLGVFSDEANKDASDRITSIGNMVSINGGTVRQLGILADQTIVGFTA